MIENVIKQISDVEREFHNQPLVIQGLEQKIESIAATPAAYNLNFLLYRNHFRVKHAAHMKVQRPRLFVGLINYDIYPNFQTVGLLLFGDIVSLSQQRLVQGRSDRVSFNAETDDLSEVIQKLPQGFVPDYYWDPQVCGSSIPPLGLDKLPFPTVASICHTFRGVNTLYISRLYDVVAPVSKAFVELYKRSHPDKLIMDLPFGGNWGSFHLNTQIKNPVKDIDLVVSFGRTDRPEYGGFRNVAIELAQAFQEKYQGRFVVEFISGVDYECYSATLARSKIGLNVVGYNGPYNYRSCELINHSVALMQMDVDFGIADMTMADYFTPNKEYIPFDVQNFEEVLLRYLEDPDETRSIVVAAKKRLEQHYSYQAIQLQLFNHIKSIDKDALLSSRMTGEFAHRNWLNMLTSSPQHHSYKHKIFSMHSLAQFNVNSEDSIRRLLISLPILVESYGQDLAQLLPDPELAKHVSASTWQGILYLSGLIPSYQRRLTDDWTLCCYQALYGEIDHLALTEISSALMALDPADPNSPDLDYDILPLAFGVPVKDYDTARKQILDIPFSLAAGEPERYRAALRNYMCWWCEYFYSQTLKAGDTSSHVSFA